MNKENLKKIANQMVIKGKGILAADESTPTCTKRFETIGIERLSYLEMNTETCSSRHQNLKII